MTFVSLGEEQPRHSSTPTKTLLDPIIQFICRSLFLLRKPIRHLSSPARRDNTWRQTGRKIRGERGRVRERQSERERARARAREVKSISNTTMLDAPHTHTQTTQCKLIQDYAQCSNLAEKSKHEK